MISKVFQALLKIVALKLKQQTRFSGVVHYLQIIFYKIFNGLFEEDIFFRKLNDEFIFDILVCDPDK